MSKREHDGETSNTKSKRLKKGLSVDEAKTKIVNQIIQQIKEVLEDPAEEKDSTNDLRDTIIDIFQGILDEFKGLQSGENEDKKSFIGSQIKIFTILLSSRIRTLTKIKNVLRVHTNITLDF